MIIAVDFDGTIVKDEYPNIGKFDWRAKMFINSLHDRGHYIILWTCRKGDKLIEAVNFLINQNVKFDRINDNHPDNIKTYGDGGRKIYADIYIDDKQPSGFVDWEEVYNLIIKKENDDNKIKTNQTVSFSITDDR